MKFNFEDYKGNYVMHCKTEEEAKDFCRVMHKNGLKWITGESYLVSNKWNDEKEKTCYNFNVGTYDVIRCFKHKESTILEWSNFMNKEFTKDDLKNGMVLKDREGSLYIWLNNTMMCEDGVAYSSIAQDLTGILGFKQYDIVEIYNVDSSAKTINDWFKQEYLTSIWKREEEVAEMIIVEMTIEEIKEKLGVKNLKIII